MMDTKLRIYSVTTISKAFTNCFKTEESGVRIKKAKTLDKQETHNLISQPCTRQGDCGDILHLTLIEELLILGREVPTS